MNIKDLINCPHCGRPNIFSQRHEHYPKYFDLNDDIISTNFTDDIYCSFIESIFQSFTRDSTNISNSFLNPCIYSITNFNFFIDNKKSNNNIINEEKNMKEIKFNTFKCSKKLGRKTKRNTESSFDGINKEIHYETHDKFRDDNMRKKCKNIILKYLFEFINYKLKIIYKNDIGNGDFKKELKILDQRDKNKSTIESDRAFLEKKLIDIFSQKISSRCCNFSSEHNKIIIESLINEEDEEKKNYFIKLFNLKFSDCLKYFIGEKYFNVLEGMKVFSSIKENLLKENGEKYINQLLYYLKNYQEIISKKSKRINKK